MEVDANQPGRWTINLLEEALRASARNGIRATGASDWAWLATVVADSTQFSDYKVLPSTSYSYRVRAVNDTDASACSNQASVITLPGP